MLDRFMLVDLARSILPVLVAPILLALVLPHAYAVTGESFNIAISVRGTTIANGVKQDVSMTLYGQGLVTLGSKLIKFSIQTGELRVGTRVIQVKGGPGALSVNSGVIMASADTKPDVSGRVFTITISGILHFRMLLPDGTKNYDLNVQNARISDTFLQVAGCPSGCYQGQLVQYVLKPQGAVTLQSLGQAT